MPPSRDHTLELCKEKLLTIEGRTDRKKCTRDFLDRLEQWRADVRSAGSARLLAGEFADYVEATSGATFSTAMQRVREVVAELPLLSSRELTSTRVLQHVDEYGSTVVHGAWAAYREQQRQRSDGAAPRTWKVMGGVAGAQHSAFATDPGLVWKAINRQVAQRLDRGVFLNERECAMLCDAELAQIAEELGLRRAAKQELGERVQRHLRMGAGFLVLPQKPRLAKEQLEEERASGAVRLSGSAAHVLARARSNDAAVLLAWTTDALLLPPLGVNCVLALLPALLGTTLRALGVAADPLVQCSPRVVSCGDVVAMRDRARDKGAAFGALQLPRAREVTSASDMLQATWGVFLFLGLLLRGDTLHRHACGFNAGAGLFYVNPEVVVVTAVDRMHPELFLARMQCMYGLYVPALSARMLAITPRLAHTRQLPCATPLASLAVVAAATGAQGRKHTRTGGKTHRGKRKRACK